MSSSFEKSVKGGTKVKLAAPKSKYVEHILMATQSGEAGVAEVFRTLTHRLRDATWTVAFKALIIVHLMIKEGAPEVTLKFLSASPRNSLATNQFTVVQTQGQNIRRYSEYLSARAQAYATGKCDYARAPEGRMKRLTVDKGLLRETELVQAQIKELVKCDLLTNDMENEISLTAFRLLTRDLLDLYNAENEAVMNVLSHYFEMSRPDAERAVKIYKKFCTQTDQVVQFLSISRQYEHATRLEIPKIKHAPTSLAKSLQDYLDDKDFEVNRRQYLAEHQAKSSGRMAQGSSRAKSPPTALEAFSRPADTKPAAAPTAAAPVAASVAATQPPKGPAPDLIDFFESIEQNQQPLEQNTQQYQSAPMNGYMTGQQQMGFQQQAMPTGYPQNGFAGNAPNPFLQQHQQQSSPPVQQPQYTGAGFGGYGPQAPQQFVGGSSFPAQQPQQGYISPPPQMQSPVQSQMTGAASSNPFRQSMMPTGAESMTFAPPQRQGTNPFARTTATPPDGSMAGSGFAQSPPPQQQQQPLQAQATGTNPFARTPQAAAGASSPPLNLQVQPTGSTNPFRQSAFVNQAMNTGWQNAPQGTMGGYESLETVPVFPRPGAAPAAQQQQQQSPWG